MTSSDDDEFRHLPNRRADEVVDETLGEASARGSEEGRPRHPEYHVPASTLGGQYSGGQVVAEYALLEELGRGHLGLVFKAVHCKLNHTVAVKLLPESLMQSPESVERFQREVQALARLSHPNVVAVREAGTVDGTHFYAMDFVDGEDLRRLVLEYGPMPVEQALDCILQAARGLEYAHAQGIVHGDVKPSKLILDNEGTAKILGLGIARLCQDLMKTEYVPGTANSMPPAGTMYPWSVMNAQLADHRGDIYSLGCTLWFLLTGQPLFGDTFRELLTTLREHRPPPLRKACPAAPARLERVLGKMVAKRPEDRYPSMTALLSDLTQNTATQSWWRRLLAAAKRLIGLA